MPKSCRIYSYQTHWTAVFHTPFWSWHKTATLRSLMALVAPSKLTPCVACVNLSMEPVEICWAIPRSPKRSKKIRRFSKTSKTITQKKGSKLGHQKMGTIINHSKGCPNFTGILICALNPEGPELTSLYGWFQFAPKRSQMGSPIWGLEVWKTILPSLGHFGC